MTNPLAPLTLRGKSLLAAGVATAGCAVLLDERDLLRIAAFVILLPLVALLPVAVGKRRVSARRALRPERVTAGNEGEVELMLTRTGNLPTGRLLLDDDTADLPGTRSRILAGPVSAHHNVAVRYPIHPARRGLHRIGPLRATIVGPFGLTESNRVLCGHSDLLVIPRTHPLHGMPWPADGDEADGHGSRQHTGQDRPDVIVRQYRHGDDPRRVHWPSTARTDEIMVRVDEHPASEATTVLLDRRGIAHDSATSAAYLEWAVSFVASVALHLNAAGHTVRVVTERGDTLADLTGNAGHDDVVSLLETLATVRSAPQHTITTARQLGADHRVIAVLGTLEGDTTRQLARGGPRRRQAFAVVPDNARNASADSAAEADRFTEPLHAAGWQTAVADPQCTVAAVWGQLCGSAAHLDRWSATTGDGP